MREEIFFKLFTYASRSMLVQNRRFKFLDRMDTLLDFPLRIHFVMRNTYRKIWASLKISTFVVKILRVGLFSFFFLLKSPKELVHMIDKIKKRNNFKRKNIH